MNLLKKIRYNKYFFPCASYFRQLLISIYGNDHKCGYEKWVLFVLKMIVSPFIIPCYLLYGLFMFKRQLRWDRKSTFEYQLTMVAIVKNEASYLQEWVEYYRLIGVDHFVVYDNESDDDTKEVLLGIDKLKGGA